MTEVPARRILVVLDPNYGARLLDLPEGQPAWVVESAANTPVIQTRWRTAPNDDYLTGITIMNRDEAGQPMEEQFLYWLGTIDDHHDASSSDLPYTALDVVGVYLSPAIRQALSELGFENFEPMGEGFLATRSEENAARTWDWGRVKFPEA
jgi:hypothetical protein